VSVSAPQPVAAPAPRLLCDRVLCNVARGTVDRLNGKAADVLELSWLDCARRAVRKRASSGREVGILLPPGVTLSHGDVLFEDERSYVVVEVMPCDLWRVTASSPGALARIALELGNLHVPVEVTPDGELLTPPDGPTDGALRRNGGTRRLCRRRFAPLRATVTSRLSVAKRLQVAGVAAKNEQAPSTDEQP
jgi:urease accessory protein